MTNKPIRQPGGYFTAAWEFYVRPEKRRAFEKVYGSKGDWARLFRQDKAYIGTELIRDPATPRRYVTLDFWTSRLAYLRFKRQNLAAYKALDKRCASLTKRERLIGEFEKPVPPILIWSREAGIRTATPADIPAMVALEQATAFAAHWNETAYREIFKPGAPPRIALLSEHTDGSPVGFVVARISDEDCELENIVVKQRAQRQGIGFQLIKTLRAEARVQSASRILIEVRESNIAARRLYEKCGFEITGLRRSYYSDPVEDAVLFVYKEL
jgi:ribosomal-protein-alanine N-acetyltransferase